VTLRTERKKMRKAYRMTAVERAVENWNRSEWFTSSELLDLVVDYLPQRNMGINTFGVAKMLRRLEVKGVVESERTHYGKKYRRCEGVKQSGGV